VGKPRTLGGAVGRSGRWSGEGIQLSQHIMQSSGLGATGYRVMQWRRTVAPRSKDDNPLLIGARYCSTVDVDALFEAFIER
jgi:hypothetical protein